MHGHFHSADAQARRYDPTGTGDIRSHFRGDLAQRWRKLRLLVREAILGSSNMLGLGPLTARSLRADPVREFQQWLDAALQQVVLAGKGEWTQHYLDEAAARARSRAYKLVPARPGGEVEHSHPVVVASAAVELQGVVEAVSQRVMRSISQGLLAKQSGRGMAQAAAEAIRAIGQTRSMALAEMSVNSAFNNASLDAFKALGLRKVSTEPEYIPAGARLGRPAHDAKRKRRNTAEIVEVLTAGDDLVCEECQGISEDGPYEISEARDLIPAHPNCRCAFVPFFDERFAALERG